MKAIEPEYGDLISRDYYYTTLQVSRRCELSKRRIQQAVHTNKLEESDLVRRVGNQWLWSEQAIQIIEDRKGMFGNPEIIARSKKLKRIAKRKANRVKS